MTGPQITVRCVSCGDPLEDDGTQMEEDRDYFLAHRDLKEYIRRPIGNEHPFACLGFNAVRVVELAPGVRYREGINVKDLT